MGFFGDITGAIKSVTSIAKSTTGSIKDFRQVYGSNAGLLGLALPPQVSLGIKAANALGIKVPSQEVLSKQVMSELDKAVFGVYRPNTEDLKRALKGQKQSDTPGLDRYLKQLQKDNNPTIDKINTEATSVDEVLNSISWLL